MVFLIRGRDGENIEKKKKTDRRNKFKNSKMTRKKNEEYKESQITIKIMFGFMFYTRNHILLENIV